MKRLFLIVLLLFSLNLTAQDWKIHKVGNGGWEVEEEFTLNKKKEKHPFNFRGKCLYCCFGWFKSALVC